MRVAVMILALTEALASAVEHENTAKSDARHIVTCKAEPVLLHCDSADNILAVREASYFETGHICSGPVPLPPPEPRDPDVEANRHSLHFAVNQRCAGKSDCEFVLSRDRPNTWLPGVLYISYLCLPGQPRSRFCSEKLTAGDGVITNPGYPSYYPGDVNCSWTVETEPGRTIRLAIYDLNIRDRTSGGQCVDFVRITDGPRVLLLTCHSSDQPVTVVSHSARVTITLSSHGHLINTMRGFLLHYSALGCKTPEPPQHGYLVQRNITHALFSCSVNFVFADSGQQQQQQQQQQQLQQLQQQQQQRWLHCHQETAQWDSHLPDTCTERKSTQPPTLLPDSADSTAVTAAAAADTEMTAAAPPAAAAADNWELDSRDRARPVRPVATGQNSLLLDMVVPLVVLLSLILINVAILFAIYRYRRRQRKSAGRFETRESKLLRSREQEI